MNKVKHFIQQSWLLIVVSFFFGLLIAVTNAALSPMIEQHKIDKLNDLITFLLPEAKHFNKVTPEIEVESTKAKKQMITIYKAVADEDKCVGWSFTGTGPGFADKIELVIAVDKDFQKLAGFNVLVSNETPGFGDQIKSDYFRNQFKGAPAGGLNLAKAGDPKKIDSEIVAITGATVSSEAVVKIINHYIEQVKNEMQKRGLLANGK